MSKKITLRRADCNIKKGEDSGAAGPHIAEVKQHGGHPVLARLLGPVHGVEVVHVGLVVTPNAVGDDLQGLGIPAIKTHSSASQVTKVSHQRVQFCADTRIGLMMRSEKASFTNTTTAAPYFTG